MADVTQMGPRRKALVDGLAGNTGVSGMAPGGIGVPQIESAAPAPAAPAAPDYSKPGQFLPGNGSGYDPTKGLEGGNTAKYKMRNVLSHFDPKLGLNQAGLMDALNSAGIGKFRAADGDELVLEGDADPSFGRTRHFDVIPNFDGGNASTWGYLQQDKGGVMGGRPAAPAVNPMIGGGNVAPMLQGDAAANVQAALQNIGGLADTSRIQQLIAALKGGQ